MAKIPDFSFYMDEKIFIFRLNCDKIVMKQENHRFYAMKE